MQQKKIAAIYPQTSNPKKLFVMAKQRNETIELEDRDPNTLSQHLQVSWDEVFGEPNSIRSPEFAWSVSQKCFKASRNCCYICLSVLIAPLTAFFLGLTFACLSFEHIWCLNPCLRVWKISCTATRNFLMALTYATIIPCSEALGYVFSQIKVRNQQIVQDEERKDVLMI